MSKIVTLSDVAGHAGVSKMTVSRYFNAPHQLSTQTRIKIQQAVEQLGYIPNYSARALKTGRSNLVAVLVPNVANSLFTIILRGIEDVALAAGYTVLMGSTDDDPLKERRYLEILISQGIRGLIMSPIDASNLCLLETHNIPFVSMDREVQGVEIRDVVSADSYEGGRMLVRHLVDEGFTKITFIGGSPLLSSARARQRGYADAMEAAGLCPVIHEGDYTYLCGRAITARLIEEQALPEAFIAANNRVAVGAVQMLREHKYSVPFHVAIACFDNPEIVSMTHPFLTYVAQPFSLMGRTAMEILIKRMKGDPVPRLMPFAFKLVPGLSSRKR